MALQRRKRQRLRYDPDEEARLERLVFGDSKDVIENLFNAESPAPPTSSVIAEENRVQNDRRDSVDQDSTDQSDDDSEIETESAPVDLPDKKEKRAWVDEDDEKYSVDEALSIQNRKCSVPRPEKSFKKLLDNKFIQLHGTPNWAKMEKDKDLSDSDEEILKHSNHLALTKIKNLRKGVIDIKALKLINQETHEEGQVLTSLQFHPTSTVAFVAGLKGVVSVFQIDGRDNTKLQSIYFEKFRVNAGRFIKEGNEIILGSRNRQFCQIYDLMSGKIYKCQLPYGVTSMKKFEVSPDGKLIAVAGRCGEVHMLTAKTRELINTLKMNNKCRALAFTPDSKTLITHGDSDEIYSWDINSRTCMNKAIDDGCLSSGAIAVSPSRQFLATGSKQGVVNIYDLDSVIQSRSPKPLKMIMNLVTPITSLMFNPTSEILAMASDSKDNAFKMVHLPSFNVFSNFPTFQTTMHKPLAIDFSPNSGYLGISNNKGNAYLYRLKHYGNY